MNPLEASFRACRDLAWRSGSNFYLPLLLLPRRKRRAMQVLYAFFRHVDDLADGDAPPEEKRRALAECHATLDRLSQGPYRQILYPALDQVVEEFAIPLRHLHGVVSGAEQDLDHTRYETFDDLVGYCRLVASAVGMACLPVWGFARPETTAEDPEVRAAADACGLAFQLTNILRDLAEDAAAGRCYLPGDELRRFGVREADLAAGKPTPEFLEMMRFQMCRVQRYFAEAAPLHDWLSRDGRRVYKAMLRTYLALFEQIVRREGDVLSARISLSRGQRLRCALGACFGPSPRA